MARGPSWRQAVLGMLAAACLVLLIVWAGPDALWDRLRGIAPRYVLLGFGAALLSYVLKGARYLLVLGRRAGVRRVFGIAVAQNVIAQLLPMRAGDVSYVVLARKTGVASTGYALASLLLVRLVDLAILWGMYVVSLSMLSLSRPVYQWTAMFVGAALTVAIVAVGVLVSASDRVAPCVERVLTRVGLFRWVGTRKMWDEFVEAGRNLRQAVRPGRLIAIVLVSVGVWTVSVVWNYLVWLAVGARLTATQAVFMTSLSYLVTLLPVFLLGGAGVGDLIATGVLTAFGRPADASATFSLCNRVLATAYQALFAVVFFVVMWGQWRVADEPQTGEEARP